MLAQDVKPDRLTRAKLAVTDLVAKLDGDGVGLVAFAGNAFLQCPVTLDYDAFRESLDALDTNTIPRGGTDIASAIRESEAVFKTRTAAEKILVLITDGEDLGGEGITAAQEAAKDGVKIFTVGVGSATGELIPVPSGNGGDRLRQRRQRPTREVAPRRSDAQENRGGHGRHVSAARPAGRGSHRDLRPGARAVHPPRSQFAPGQGAIGKILLGAARRLACFVSEMLIGNRRRIACAENRAGSGEDKTRCPACVRLPPPRSLLSRCSPVIASAHAASPQSAEQAYQKGDFAKAQQEYAAAAAKQPGKAELQFNTGSAAYKAGDYAQAATDFQQSLNTGQVPVQQGAYYNLGNTQYRLGQKTEKENPQDTIKTWEGAVKSYDAALQIAANDTEAKHNRDLVQQKIDQLKKQEEQKKQDQQKQDNKDQKKQPKDQQKDSKVDSKDQKAGDKGQQKDSKDQLGGSKDQQSDAKDNNGGAGDQKNGQKDSKPGEQQKPGESQDQKGGDQNKKEDGKGQQVDTKQGEPKDQNADANPQAGDGKKDQQQSQKGEANSGNNGQPKPVNAGDKPSQGDAQAANGGQPGDAQAAAAADQKREPGQMTREEAKQLLDGLKGDEGKVPAISARGRAGVQPDESKPIKDW